ncbi:hypothetical protein SeMB42_g03835 [Synchytrium endobioticum]|uniref:Non-canonical E2 ubiquitin-conjugating enzyme C-terminal domain-containing protein n=1 Tax=Synchytrium endobioticum TaxID=286115 RepID=A0A507D3K1_9FUNG|nr:hypothetical protein SeMB42_g03835 [Synchytrium endobioticum]
MELDEPKEEYSPVLPPATPACEPTRIDHDEQAAMDDGHSGDVSMQSPNPPAPNNRQKYNLSDVLDGRADHLLTAVTGHQEHISSLAPVAGYASSNEGDDIDADDVARQEGYCVECDDVPATGRCDVCNDDYCQVCYHHQHRKGSRKLHTLQVFPRAEPSRSPGTTPATKATSKPMGSPGSSSLGLPSLTAMTGAVAGSKSPKAGVLSFLDRYRTKATAPDSDDDSEDQAEQPEYLTPAPTSVRQAIASPDEYMDRSRYIPLRLEYIERKYVRLIASALDISEYTDKIDIHVVSNKPKRTVGQIKELCQILSGLVVAADYKSGQELFQSRDFAENETFYQQIFELGRRHKVMNPDKMRTSYGKLLYMLMDSQIPEITEMLGFSCVIPIKTVYSTLEAKQALNVLSDELMPVATEEIVADGKSRGHVQQEIKKKERAIEYLARKYGHAAAPPELIRQCLYSIGDNNAFLRQNRDPCDKMLYYLTKYFAADKIEKQYSLGISAGKGGARLTHNHQRQYHYVFQSLTLWSMVLHDFYKLWMLAEADLLDSGNMYRLRDTGQGLNRVQHAPRVSRLMHLILSQAQAKVGTWIGSSVIHLGDHNVPNAFMFIDKYNQISRILGPVVLTLDKIGEVAKEPALRRYIESMLLMDQEVIIGLMLVHALTGD